MTTHELARALLAGPDMLLMLRGDTGDLHMPILHYDAAGTRLAWLEADDMADLDLDLDPDTLEDMP